MLTSSAQTEERGPQGAKVQTLVPGLDDILEGGVPAGRVTLVCGGPGCGKTLLGLTFAVRAAQEMDEPSLFISFEEKRAELAATAASLGYDVERLVADKKLALDSVRVDRRELISTGEYDLGGLFARLGLAIERIGARRIVLDSLDNLFSGFGDPTYVRPELQRLCDWLKERGVTAMMNAERSGDALTRSGVEEFITDCVILLDHRVQDQISTRRLRVVKCRGSAHGTNEYPFLIEAGTGIVTFPITAAGLDHTSTTERVSTGIEALDLMLHGGGYFRGSTVLVSGGSGTGKTSLAAKFVEAACARGEKSLYFAFEESPAQITRNMRSIGIDLAPWIEKGLLHFSAARPDVRGLEVHLAVMMRDIDKVRPEVVAIDPMTGMKKIGSGTQVHAMLLRLVDLLKARGITTFLAGLEGEAGEPHETQLEISSLIDTWLLLRNVECNGEYNRVLYVRKSRGMAHSNQVREFLLSDEGPVLLEPYLGSAGVLTGSARLVQEIQEAEALLLHKQDIVRKQRDLQRRRQALEARRVALEAQLHAAEAEEQALLDQESQRERTSTLSRSRVAASRHDADREKSDRGR